MFSISFFEEMDMQGFGVFSNGIIATKHERKR